MVNGGGGRSEQCEEMVIGMVVYVEYLIKLERVNERISQSRSIEIGHLVSLPWHARGDSKGLDRSIDEPSRSLHAGRGVVLTRIRDAATGTHRVKCDAEKGDGVVTRARTCVTI